MMKAMIFALLFTLISFAHAANFSAIEISGWKKEELAHDHLRFSQTACPDYTIHVQVDSYDPKESWDQKKISEDIKKMEKIRNGMSFFMGMNDYKITSYKYDGKKLELVGSYIGIGKKQIVFKEINFYHREHFLQFKLISDSKLPSEKEFEKMISAINPDQVDID
jgi:hypothetical protein